MFTSVTAAAQKVPAYCTSGTGIHNQQQWETCWKLGLPAHEPTTVASNVGYFSGHNIGPVLIAALIIFAVFALMRRRTPATSKG